MENEIIENKEIEESKENVETKTNKTIVTRHDIEVASKLAKKSIKSAIIWLVDAAISIPIAILCFFIGQSVLNVLGGVSIALSLVLILFAIAMFSNVHKDKKKALDPIISEATIEVDGIFIVERKENDTDYYTQYKMYYSDIQKYQFFEGYIICKIPSGAYLFTFDEELVKALDGNKIKRVGK